MSSRLTRYVGLFGLALLSTNVTAATTAAEAAKLGTTLTPVGGEMAGNAAGTIPKWTGAANFTQEQKGLDYKTVKSLFEEGKKVPEEQFKSGYAKAMAGGDIFEAIPGRVPIFV